ncbi:DUF4386 family protein [Granulicella sp. S156]|uniref:DUF4386 family protein n=1 Tax=Granulicella sp. S156 TaxID=1747224 RepID=UPI00131DB8F7|nr:DUF4386 family protein [Granulicella sp. S156]
MARTTGLIYLLYFLTAIVGQVLLSKHFAVSGKVTNFISIALYLVLGILFCRLFWPSGRILSSVAMLFNFAGVAMMLPELYPSGKPPANPLLFFGVYCFLIGVLILRSAFLPRALGLLILIAGFGWFVFLAPWRMHGVAVFTEVLGFVAEAALMLWLLVKGVNEQRWVEQARGH